MLLKNFHIIEKGLSLSQPRPGFGQPIVSKTIKQISEYINKYGVDDSVLNAITALRSYQEFNAQNNVTLEFVDDALDNFNKITLKMTNGQGGVVTVSREDILELCSGGFSQLANNRHSIRVFSEKPVSEELIMQAAEISRKTPSVCNRQAARIFVFGSECDKSKLLALQGGNRGFGHLASHVVAITSDLQCFTGTCERNQAYVDGGLMAMTFVYALQSLGVGSCFLNWSVNADLDMGFKKVSGIPASHVIVSLLAIGNIPSELKVAESPRLNLNEILHMQ